MGAEVKIGDIPFDLDKLKNCHQSLFLLSEDSCNC